MFNPPGSTGSPPAMTTTMSWNPIGAIGDRPFDPMSRYFKKQDGREQEHVTRRRRLSLQSSCSADDDDAINHHHPGLGDIRTELQLLDSDEQRKLLLPDPKDNVSPSDFLKKLVKSICGMDVIAQKARSLNNFFCQVSEKQMEAYTVTVVSTVRNNDLESLKKLQAEGQALNCFNRFGESLLHMACRRGFEDIVEYLLDQPEVDVRICDDNGRTVLHDACWNPLPQLKICKHILDRDPVLFFICDNRGCSPFDYARPEHFEIWRKFLLENRDSLKSLQDDEIVGKLFK
jgi:hypothetical protein